MTSFFFTGIPWVASFLLFLLVFGVMPGIVLRLIVRAHPRETGRREELVAELYSIPPLRRPLWVAEQLELALTEGLVQRLSRSPDWMARVALRLVFRSQAIFNHMTDALDQLPRWYRPWWAVQECASAIRWGSHYLDSGIARNATYPESFWIPDRDEKDAVVPGVHVKLMFLMKHDDFGERMWVRVDRRRGDKLKGTLDNVPVGFPRIGAGDRVRFTFDHVIDIDWQSNELVGVH